MSLTQVSKRSIALGLSYTPTPPGPPRDPNDYHAMSAFGVVLCTNLLSLVVIAVRRDIVCCVAATWLAVSLWTARPKPASVYVRFTAKFLKNTYQIEMLFYR